MYIGVLIRARTETGSCMDRILVYNWHGLEKGCQGRICIPGVLVCFSSSECNDGCLVCNKKAYSTWRVMACQE